MSKKQTYTDPNTGEEVESTWLARGVAGLLFGVVFGLTVGLVTSLAELAGLGGGRWPGTYWLFMSIGLGLFGLLLGGFSSVKSVRGDHFNQIHDTIARTQHRRRILRSQEHQAVPDTAISRAQPPGEPQPNDAALSIADDPDEPARLSVEIEEHTEDQVPVRQ